MTINATAVWRVRPAGSNSNGGGYDSGIAGAGTDYSQQNSAQATGTHGTATGTTAFSDVTANNFTSLMVGNALYINGVGFTTGWYFCVGFTSSSAITLDRSPGTGAAATWSLGGAWADPWTNLQTTTDGVVDHTGPVPPATGDPGPVVPGNIVYTLGSGTPNPASYTFDYTLPGSQSNWVHGSNTDGAITIANDPATPGYKAWPDTTGGMPTISGNGNYFMQDFSSVYIRVFGLYGVLTGPQAFTAGFSNSTWGGCVIDQVLEDRDCFNFAGLCIGCEAFSSNMTPGGTSHAISRPGMVSCNVHDTNGNGVQLGKAPVVSSIIAKCGSLGIDIDNQAQAFMSNNTIDANHGSGIRYQDQRYTTDSPAYNNIITNHATAGTWAIEIGNGTAAQNTTIAELIDGNVFYGNTADLRNLNYGPHDTVLGANPYVGQATEDYSLA